MQPPGRARTLDSIASDSGRADTASRQGPGRLRDFSCLRHMRPRIPDGRRLAPRLPRCAAADGRCPRRQGHRRCVRQGVPMPRRHLLVHVPAHIPPLAGPRPRRPVPAPGTAGAGAGLNVMLAVQIRVSASRGVMGSTRSLPCSYGRCRWQFGGLAAMCMCMPPLLPPPRRAQRRRGRVALRDPPYDELRPESAPPAATATADRTASQ